MGAPFEVARAFLTESGSLLRGLSAKWVFQSLGSVDGHPWQDTDRPAAVNPPGRHGDRRPVASRVRGTARVADSGGTHERKCTNRAPSMQIKTYHLYETFRALVFRRFRGAGKMYAERSSYGHMRQRVRRQVLSVFAL